MDGETFEAEKFVTALTILRKPFQMNELRTLRTARLQCEQNKRLVSVAWAIPEILEERPPPGCSCVRI
jgi:hypothetical protein